MPERYIIIESTTMSQFLNRVIARTQNPTEINCASEYFTFGNITEVNPTREPWEDLALGEPTTFLMVVKLLSQVSMLDSGSAKNQLNYITGKLLIPICPGGIKQSLLTQNGKSKVFKYLKLSKIYYIRGIDASCCSSAV